MDILDASLCMQQEFCTYCSLRAKCAKRITFYNEKQFLDELVATDMLAISMLESLGFPEECITLSRTIFLQTMTKKRNRELEENPIYSPV